MHLPKRDEIGLTAGPFGQACATSSCAPMPPTTKSPFPDKPVVTRRRGQKSNSAVFAGGPRTSHSHSPPFVPVLCATISASTGRHRVGFESDFFTISFFFCLYRCPVLITVWRNKSTRVDLISLPYKISPGLHGGFPSAILLHFQPESSRILQSGPASQQSRHAQPWHPQGE
jgi:hypothetical protein